MPHKSAAIYIAIYISDVQTPWVKSLKEKRSILKPVTEKMKLRFPVSVARIDGLNEKKWERIAVTAVSGDAKWLRELLERIHSFIRSESNCDVNVLESHVERWDLEA